MILVTGAAGFLGSRLIADLCHEGYQVRAVVRNRDQAPLVQPQVEKIQADVRDQLKMAKAAAGCEAIVHLAAKVHAVDDLGNEQDYRAVNVEGTRNVLEGAMASGITRLLFVSTVKVFGEETNGRVDETAAPNPQTPYGRSKWEAERLVTEYALKGRMLAISLRLPMVYGPTMKGNLYRMISAVDRGRFPPLPQLAARRSMLHVNNFIQAVRVCLAAPQFNRSVYIVTDAQAYTSTELYESICRGLGKPVPAWRVPLALLKAGSGLGDVLQALTRRRIPFTSATLRKLIKPALYSSDAIARDLGYQPIFSFQDAVPELIAFYRRNQA